MPKSETLPPDTRDAVRWRCAVFGYVQGVGFRPSISSLARSLGLTGFVGNDASGVFVEVQGPAMTVAEFGERLWSCVPHATVETVRVTELPPQVETAFAIAPSQEVGGTAVVPPDVAPCDECLRDLTSPSDRRSGYPFVACSQCGPRFTLLQGMPFDRPNTAMAAFPMCPKCEAEYRDPANRRFHAQTAACPACGPRVWFAHPADTEAIGEASIPRTREALATGLIVAVKGVGGFHLACDATSDVTVRRLRAGKGRGDKPFALMAATPDVVREYAELGPDEERILTDRERPIVLLRRRNEEATLSLSPAVAPCSNYLGFMLPYTPLHHLLLSDRPLVMTSGNASGEPIATTNAEARGLAPQADAFLLHDREIVTPCDDSVVCVFEGDLYPIRRSRGYAPLPVRLREGGPSVLAVGGELKAAFCLAVGDQAFMSQHVGDLSSPTTLAAFGRSVEHLTRLLRVEPMAVACDEHPDYLSSRWAKGFAVKLGLPLIRVQHHRAHVAALAAEHRHAGSLIGVCLDGAGYGDDGAVWGCELFAGEVGNLERVAHLDYVPLPGGDAAVKRPYRMALSHLWAAGLPWDDSLPCVRACPPAERKVLLRQLTHNVNSVPTSSAGRLFDAVASLVGVRHTVTYEAQAAIELEAVADETAEGYDMPLYPEMPLRLDPRPVFRQITHDMNCNVSVSVIAGRFHRGLSDAIARVCRAVRKRSGVNTVALTGGVFQNLLLLRLAVKALRQDDFEVLIHRLVPPNDGGLSLGQAVIARATLAGVA
ncbi:MAG: carbamoyltransferase HypF [Planctomycetes bacterium]|nr:carbamoyltransferase HypF [Planctomycetota bacterium]